MMNKECEDCGCSDLILLDIAGKKYRITLFAVAAVAVMAIALIFNPDAFS